MHGNVSKVTECCKNYLQLNYEESYSLFSYINARRLLKIVPIKLIQRLIYYFCDAEKYESAGKH